MAEEQQPTKEQIFDLLNGKSVLKQKIYDNTFEVLGKIKLVLRDLANEYNANLKNTDRRVRLEYRDRGKFEAEIRVAGDLLIFSMHTNVFEFDRDHAIWKLSYVKDDKFASYCGVINIYNFLVDSFRYNRIDDLGYLVGRIFINRDFTTL
jgi:hypothetical protein